MPQATIVEFLPAHARAVLDVIRRVYVENGFTWNNSPYFADLHDVIGHYHQRGGMFWVMSEGLRVIGTAGVTLDGDETELHRLYLLKECRGRGWGRQLLDVTLDWSRQRGVKRMIAWSDVKLTRAHGIYRAAGFTQRGERICDDPDKAREYGFFIDLSRDPVTA